MKNLFRRDTREQLDDAVRKTREGSFSRVSDLFKQPVITDETWEELEEILIQADVGPAVALELVENARREVARQAMRTPVEAETALRRQMVEVLGAEAQLPSFQAGTVLLVVGVNGSGKTTTTAKLGKLVADQGKSCLFVAADTFRAAAIDQLKIWGQRAGIPVIAHQQEADPGAVVFDGLQAAHARSTDVVVVDTAGRLHTKFNLMEELQKIRRVVAKVDQQASVISLLVLDATNGQNGILQAKHFLEAVEVDGIVLAKLDGTAKGGVIFSVYRELKVPVWYVGTGETLEDLAPFNHLEFVNALFD